MKILVLNGPNLNMLGRRSVKHYGVLTLIDIKKLLVNLAQELGVKLVFFQSNHEGALVDAIQKYRGKVDGIMINPGA
ncbi:type II 3-dehydroquinate dehydratase, partial [Candidatus Microgenomates bacterium]|nr:type II 3-dehydroquinate dehydratase [Candidatus Microgenomates bacterium]